MKTSNSLTSHTPERNSHRIDKMSGLPKKFKTSLIGKSKKAYKKMSNKKRRILLKSFLTEKI